MKKIKREKRKDRKKSNREDLTQVDILKRNNYLTHQVNIASGNPDDTNSEHF